MFLNNNSAWVGGWVPHNQRMRAALFNVGKNKRNCGIRDLGQRVSEGGIVLSGTFVPCRTPVPSVLTPRFPGDMQNGRSSHTVHSPGCERMRARVSRA